MLSFSVSAFFFCLVCDFYFYHKLLKVIAGRTEKKILLSSYRAENAEKREKKNYTHLNCDGKT